MANKKQPAKKAAAPVASPKEMQPERPAGIKSLELPRYTLALFYTLLNVPLHGAQSRARNRVGQMVKDQVNYIEDERIKQLEDLAEKDGKGKPKRKMQGEEEVYDVSPENMAKYRKEFDEFMHEVFIIDLVPSVKADVALIRPLVLESKVPLQTVDGYAYEEICKAFENI